MHWFGRRQYHRFPHFWHRCLGSARYCTNARTMTARNISKKILFTYGENLQVEGIEDEGIPAQNATRGQRVCLLKGTTIYNDHRVVTYVSLTT